jgi:hypothetical protein
MRLTSSGANSILLRTSQSSFAHEVEIRLYQLLLKLLIVEGTNTDNKL